MATYKELLAEAHEKDYRKRMKKVLKKTPGNDPKTPIMILARGDRERQDLFARGWEFHHQDVSETGYWFKRFWMVKSRGDVLADLEH